VLRQGWNTSDESALWMINGDGYNDHRHGDYGSFILYALGAPISLDWGCMYYPRVEGSYQHSMIVPENKLSDYKGNTYAWNVDGSPLSIPEFVWRNSVSTGFVTLPLSDMTDGGFDINPVANTKESLHWTRRIQSIHPDTALPIYVIRDQFSDAMPGKNDGPRIMSLNLMASGSVATAAGEITPTVRAHPPKNVVDPALLTSAGAVFPLSQGVNRLGFRGQWGVDFDVNIISDQTSEALIGGWSHRWHPSGETNQFAKAQGRPFEETQYILRVRSLGSFCTVILPYRTGQRPNDLKVESKGNEVIVTANGQVTTIGEQSWTTTGPMQKCVTTFSPTTATLDDFVMTGGPAQMAIEPNVLRGKFTGNGTLAIKNNGKFFSGKSIYINGKSYPIKGDQAEIAGSTNDLEFIIK
jgi:hypothetical protein